MNLGQYRAVYTSVMNNLSHSATLVYPFEFSEKNVYITKRYDVTWVLYIKIQQMSLCDLTGQLNAFDTKKYAQTQLQLTKVM